jgi:alkanesulfonate monooxygenase SsuD/methylene tetrahydromethanopterin reductase-like flavin-dependent oxidoreductase (luciferase family)
MHEWLGHAEELEPLWRAWREGDRSAALAAVSDRLVDTLFVHGSPGECRDRVQCFRDAGVTTPVLSILPTGGGEEELRRTLRELAPR